MRRIFPEKQLPIKVYNSEPVTRQDLAELQGHIDEVATNLSNLANNLAEYKVTQATNTSTALLNAVRGVISTLQSTSAAITDGTFQNITVENVARLNSIIADSLNLADTLSAESIISTNGRISNLEAVKATIGELNATTVNIQNWTASVIAANTVNASTKVTTPLVEAEDVQADTVEVANKLTAAEIETDLLDVNRLNISEGIEAGELKTSFITWKNSQLITNPSDDDYYLKIPQFKNGTMYLMGTVNGAPVWSIEITNSIENYYMSWSKKETDYLRRILFSKAGDVTTLYFHGGTHGQAIKIYYAIIAGANDGVPEYYEELPTTYTSEYLITYFNGHKYWNPVDLFNEGSAVGTLTLQPRNNYSAADPLSKQYDTTTDVNFTVYLPNQNLNTDANVEFNQVTTRWLGVKEFSTRNFIATSLETLSTLDLTDFDDGSLVVVRNTSTVETKSLSTAYLKYTDDQDQPILYQLVSISGAPAIRTNKPLVYNPTTKTIEEATNVSISGNMEVGGDLQVDGALAAASFSVENLDVGNNIHAGNDLFVDNNAVIAGDLEVKGTTITFDTENVETTSDWIVLRANNAVPLQNGDYAGFVFHNYNAAGKSAAITIDNSGTFRLSTQTNESVTSYLNTWEVNEEYFIQNADFSQASKLYQNLPVVDYDEILTNFKSYKVATSISATGHLFFDPNAATITYYPNVKYANGEIILDGAPVTFTPASSDKELSIHFYTTISFIRPSASDMEPILTRNESNTLQNNDILVWDATNEKAVNITRPATSNTYLKSQIDSTTGAISYSWGAGGGNGVAFIGTRAEYETAKLIPVGTDGHIPSGSLVIITDEQNYTKGDEQ